MTFLDANSNDVSLASAISPHSAKKDLTTVEKSFMSYEDSRSGKVTEGALYLIIDH